MLWATQFTRKSTFLIDSSLIIIIIARGCHKSVNLGYKSNNANFLSVSYTLAKGYSLKGVITVHIMTIIMIVNHSSV